MASVLMNALQLWGPAQEKANKTTSQHSSRQHQLDSGAYQSNKENWRGYEDKNRREIQLGQEVAGGLGRGRQGWVRSRYIANMFETIKDYWALKQLSR